MGVAQLGAELSDSEVDDIVAFLKATTGEFPEVKVPQLPNRTADTPLPVTMTVE